MDDPQLPTPPPPDSSLPTPSDDLAREVLQQIMDNRRMAALAESCLRFRRNAADALDALLPEMILQQMDTGWAKFHTPNGRNCIVCVGVGDDVVGLLTDVVYRITHPDEFTPKETKPNDEDQDPQDA